jgi:hypothetical protein
LTYLHHQRYDVHVPNHGELCHKKAAESMSELHPRLPNGTL